MFGDAELNEPGDAIGRGCPGRDCHPAAVAGLGQEPCGATAATGLPCAGPCGQDGAGPCWKLGADPDGGCWHNRCAQPRPQPPQTASYLPQLQGGA